MCGFGGYRVATDRIEYVAESGPRVTAPRITITTPDGYTIPACNVLAVNQDGLLRNRIVVGHDDEKAMMAALKELGAEQS